jgi:hypothetical protein
LLLGARDYGCADDTGAAQNLQQSQRAQASATFAGAFV